MYRPTSTTSLSNFRTACFPSASCSPPPSSRRQERSCLAREQASYAGHAKPQVLKGLRVEGAIASVLFRIPVLAQLCHWFGSRCDNRLASLSPSEWCHLEVAFLVQGGHHSKYPQAPRSGLCWLDGWWHSRDFPVFS